MSLSISSQTSSSVAKSEYRSVALAVNGVTLLVKHRIKTIDAFRPFIESIDSLCEYLLAGVATRYRLSPTKVDSAFEDFTYQENGYEDTLIIEKSITLSFEAHKAQDSPKNNRWNTFLVHIWVLFSMSDVFSQSHDQLWEYNAALVNYLTNRTLLSRPKRDYAFGLKFQPRSRLWSNVRSLKDITMPAVSAMCVATLVAPFLILESKSNNGSIRTAENELCNAMIKGHDILNSLNLQETCFLLGVVQVEFHVRLYFSISTQAQDDRNRYVDDVYLALLDTCDLASINGCLKFLKFVSWAKTYGQNEFLESFTGAVDRLNPYGLEERWNDIEKPLKRDK